jgi:hypothetical protein
MAAHSYKSSYPPNTQIDSGIVQFFEEFYKISDTPGDHEEYVNQFTPDATLVMASKKGVGRDGQRWVLMRGDRCGALLIRK